MDPMARASNAREGEVIIAQAEAIRAVMAAIGLHHAAEFGPTLASHKANVASATVASKGAAAAIASRTVYAGLSI
jgi:hypothetical protein